MKRLVLTLYFTAYIIWAALIIATFALSTDSSKIWWVGVLALGLPFLPLLVWRMFRNVR
jgi:hypothetical protein